MTGPQNFSAAVLCPTGPSTNPGVRLATESVAQSSTDPGTRPSVDPGDRPSVDPEATDPGLLAGVAVIVIVLVLAALSIVVLIILWR